MGKNYADFCNVTNMIQKMMRKDTNSSTSTSGTSNETVDSDDDVDQNCCDVKNDCDCTTLLCKTGCQTNYKCISLRKIFKKIKQSMKKGKKPKKSKKHRKAVSLTDVHLEGSNRLVDRLIESTNEIQMQPTIASTIASDVVVPMREYSFVESDHEAEKEPIGEESAEPPRAKKKKKRKRKEMEEKVFSTEELEAVTSQVEEELDTRSTVA